MLEKHIQKKLYSKRMKSTTKFHAHDEENIASVSDAVKIMSTDHYLQQTFCV